MNQLKITRFLTASLFCLSFGLSPTLCAAQTLTPAPSAVAPAAPVNTSARWEKSIAAFEAADLKSPPPQHAVLFIGASSIRFWTTLARDFPNVPTINRGFGGSQIADSTYFADRIVVPYHPRQIVFFGGDNDLASHRTPDDVVADFVAFVAKVRSELPDTPIVFLSIKPSLSRRNIHEKEEQANRQLAQFCGLAKGVTYVDMYTPILGADGQPRAELFRPDGLHLNAEGYAIWTKTLAPYIH